jgi:pimeloyl-ACP methyl ester carboxylesterase
VVLIRGYPLNGNSWERQERELLASGHRVISYDRRGFGRSSQPTVGYDYDVDVLGGSRISDRAWQASFNVAVGAFPFATYACVDTWLTDFRPDLPKIDVPVLVVHGTEDRILPYNSTATRLPALIADCTLVPVEGGPRNIAWTHPKESIPRSSTSSTTHRCNRRRDVYVR